MSDLSQEADYNLYSPSVVRVEGGGLRRDDRAGEAASRAGGEPAKGAASSEHSALPRPNYRPGSLHSVHRDGVLRG